MFNDLVELWKPIADSLISMCPEDEKTPPPTTQIHMHTHNSKSKHWENVHTGGYKKREKREKRERELCHCPDGARETEKERWRWRVVIIHSSSWTCFINTVFSFSGSLILRAVLSPWKRTLKIPRTIWRLIYSRHWLLVCRRIQAFW